MPWLKSPRDDVRITAFLIGSSIVHLIDVDVPAILMLGDEESKKYVALFTGAVASSCSSVTLCNNLLSISVQTLLKGLKHILVSHHHLLNSLEVFNAVITLLHNGRISGLQKNACCFIASIENWPLLDDSSRKFSLLEILKQLEQSEDCELKSSAQNALEIVQGCSIQGWYIIKPWRTHAHRGLQ